MLQDGAAVEKRGLIWCAFERPDLKRKKMRSGCQHLPSCLSVEMGWYLDGAFGLVDLMAAARLRHRLESDAGRNRPQDQTRTVCLAQTRELARVALVLRSLQTSLSVACWGLDRSGMDFDGAVRSNSAIASD